MRAATGPLLVMLLSLSAPAAAGSERVLRVCADPNNLPFSSQRTPGFEDEIARVLARALGARLEYTWWAQRRGFFRNTLKARSCDVVIGVPVGLGMARTTAPYYRSAYVFVSRADRGLGVRSLDDPRLRTWKIGVQLVGDEGANPPPVHALARRGIVDNVVGFNVLGDYRRPGPAAEVMRAVVDGRVDVALVWGPLAGGFARTAGVKLAITPVADPQDAGAAEAMAFDIAVGVRRPDTALAAELDLALAARRAEITRILDAWGVPRVPPPRASRDPEAAR